MSIIKLWYIYLQLKETHDLQAAPERPRIQAVSDHQMRFIENNESQEPPSKSLVNILVCLSSRTISMGIEG